MIPTNRERAEQSIQQTTLCPLKQSTQQKGKTSTTHLVTSVEAASWPSESSRRAPWRRVTQHLAALCAARQRRGAPAAAAAVAPPLAAAEVLVVLLLLLTLLVLLLRNGCWKQVHGEGAAAVSTIASRVLRRGRELMFGCGGGL